MKNLIYSALFIMFTFLPATAQEWQTDFSQAKKIASEENLPILLVFQGSDWCAPCIKLDREIWSTEEFKKYAKDHFVMLQADFPKKKQHALPEAQQEHNNKLAEKYNQRGIFPLVVKLDKEGNVLGETGYYKATPAVYIKELESFKG